MSDAEELQVSGRLAEPLLNCCRGRQAPCWRQLSACARDLAHGRGPALALQELPLPALFQRARATLKQLEAAPASDPATQRLAARGAECLRAAAAAVDALALFSPNEDRDDLATGDIKYLLIPFYQAEVAGHTHAGGRQLRGGGAGAPLPRHNHCRPFGAASHLHPPMRPTARPARCPACS